MQKIFIKATNKGFQINNSKMYVTSRLLAETFIETKEIFKK